VNRVGVVVTWFTLLKSSLPSLAYQVNPVLTFVVTTMSISLSPFRSADAMLVMVPAFVATMIVVNVSSPLFWYK